MEREQQDGVQLVRAGSQGDWEEACAVFAGATAYHRYDFLQSVAPSLHCQFMPMMVLFRKKVAGVAPLLVKRLGLFSSINWVPFPYLGPLVPPELLPATLSALRLEARRLRAVNHQESFACLMPADSADGFTSVTDRTFVVPLDGRSDDDLLAAMSKTRRQDLRRAQQGGFEVVPAETADFRHADDWFSQVYAAQGLRTAYPPGTHVRVFGALKNAPGSVFYAARLDGLTVAVLAGFSTARRAFGWQSAVDPSHRTNYPQTLLHWRSLQWARDAGAIEFDMVGAPNEGIAAYKRRFGALERHYTVLQRQAGPYLKANSALSHLRSCYRGGISRQTAAAGGRGPGRGLTQ